VLIGFMGNNVLPARLGEVLRSHCAAAKTSDDRGRTNVLASVAAERILDGLILGVFALLATKLVAMDRGLKLALFLLSAAFAALTSCLVFGIHYHERIRSCIAAANRRFPGHVTAFAREKAMQFLDGLLPLGTMPRLLKALVGSWVIWTVEALCCYYIGLAVWREMRLQTALLFLVVVNFASLVPFTMGGVGSIEAVAPMYLMSSGLPAHAAFAMVLLQHGVQYVFTTIAGGIAYVGGGFYRISFVRPKEGLVTAAVRQAASQPRVMEAARSKQCSCDRPLVTTSSSRL